MTATGGRGPNLVSAPLTHGEADDSIKRVIQIGVPGTTMPAFSDFTPDELGHIVEYLRSLQKGTVRREHIPGDAALGKHLGMQCHIEMIPDMIDVWCRTGADEISRSKSPAVQSVAAIKTDLKTRLDALHAVADGVYARWIEGL